MGRDTRVYRPDAVQENIGTVLQVENTANASFTPHRFFCFAVIEKGRNGKKHDIRLITLGKVVKNRRGVAIIGVKGVSRSVELDNFEVGNPFWDQVGGDLAHRGTPGDRENLIVPDDAVEVARRKTPNSLEPNVFSH